MERLCKVCKGKLNETGFGKYKCPWCGNEYREQDFLTDEANIIADIDTYALLKKARDSIELDYDFSKSLKFSQSVLERDPFSQEANWLALLAENQIIYLQNDSGEYVPSFLQPEKSSVKHCKYYSALNSQYKADAEKVEKVRLEAVAEYERIKPYDVFISYRQHEFDGAETKEAIWARDIYTELKTNPKTKHLNVFLDQKCLTGSNAGWEPHIYSAVHSAKCMIILGSSLENINSRWVRNEWKRFLAFKSRGEKKEYIVLADESVNPLLLDEELKGKQVISNTSGKWLNDIGNRVVEICCPKMQKTEKEPKESLPSKPKKERKKMSKAAKAIISCVLAAIIFVTGGFFYWRYREEKSKQYTLHLNYGEAYGELTTVELTYDDLIPKLPGGLSISSKGYMDFVGWFTGKDCTGAQLTDAEGDSVLHLNDDLTAYSSEKHIIECYAGFRIHEYSVTFVYGDGIDSETLQVPYNTPISDIVPATRINGKAVLSWSTEKSETAEIFNDVVRQDLTLYPVEFAPCIDFDSNGGEKISSIIKKAGEQIQLPIPTRKNYKFISWLDSDGNQYDVSVMPEESQRLKAKWQAMLIFNENGGTEINDISKEAGSKISLPTPTRENYIFAGWYKNGAEKYEMEIMPAESVELTAGWYKVIEFENSVFDYTLGLSNPDMGKYKYSGLSSPSVGSPLYFEVNYGTGLSLPESIEITFHVRIKAGIRISIVKANCYSQKGIEESTLLFSETFTNIPSGSYSIVSFSRTLPATGLCYLCFYTPNGVNNNDGDTNIQMNKLSYTIKYADMGELYL